MTTIDGIPVVPLKREVGLGGDRRWVIDCPYCGREHTHGAAPGHRHSHCLRGDGYIIEHLADDGADSLSAPAGTDYTDRAVAAMIEAATEERDLGGWLSLVLVRAAAQLGSLDALTAGRPGSWEAPLVDQLARGLALDDDDLAAYRAAP
jgi:hypothetical protein